MTDMDELLTKYLDGAQFAEARAVAAGLREFADDCQTRVVSGRVSTLETYWLATLRDGLRHGASVIDQLLQLIAEKKP